MHSPRSTSRASIDGNCRLNRSSMWDTPPKRQSLELTTTYSTEVSSNSSNSSESSSEKGCKSSPTVFFPAIHQTSSQHSQSSRSCRIGTSASRNNSSQYHVRLMAELLLYQSMQLTPPSKTQHTSLPMDQKKRLHPSETSSPPLKVEVSATMGKVQLLAELLKDKIPIYTPTPRDIEQRYRVSTSATTTTANRKSKQIRRCVSLPLSQFAVETTDGRLPCGHVRLMADYLKDKIPLWQPMMSSTQSVVPDSMSAIRTTIVGTPQRETTKASRDSLSRPRPSRSFHRSASLPPQFTVVVTDEDRLPSGHVRLMADYLRDKIPVWVSPPNASRTPSIVSAHETVEATQVSIGATEVHHTNHLIGQCESIVPQVADAIDENGRSQSVYITEFLEDKIPLWRLVASCDSSDSDGDETTPITTNCSLADLIRRQIPQLIPSEQPAVRQTQSDIATKPSLSDVSRAKEVERSNEASPAIDIIGNEEIAANEPCSFLSNPSYPILCRLVQQLNNIVRSCSNQVSNASSSPNDASMKIGTNDCFCCLEVTKLLATLPSLDFNAASARVIKTGDDVLAVPLGQSPTRLPWDTFLNVPTKVDRKPLFPCLFQMNTVVATLL